MVEFKKSLLTDKNVVVHCPKEWQGKNIRDWMDANGGHWFFITSNCFGKASCYRPYSDTMGRKSTFIENGFTIVSYEDALEYVPKVGDKVVPHSKTKGCLHNLAVSSCWNRLGGKEQGYLYIRRIDGDKYVLNENNYQVTGDHFGRSDFTPYVEEDSVAQLEQEVNSLKTRVNELEEKIELKEAEKRKPRGLFLKLDGGDLNIEFEDQYFDTYILGYISFYGGFHFGFENDHATLEKYHQWLVSEQRFDDTVVSWRGGEYQLDTVVGTSRYPSSTGSVCLRNDLGEGYSFDFTKGIPLDHTDANIKTHPKSNTTIVY